MIPSQAGDHSGDSRQAVWAFWLLTVFLTISNASATFDSDGASFQGRSGYGDVPTEHGCAYDHSSSNTAWFDSNNYVLFAMQQADGRTEAEAASVCNENSDEDETNDATDEATCSSTAGSSTPRSVCEAVSRPTTDWKSAFVPALTANVPAGVFWTVFEVPKAICRVLFDEERENKLSVTATTSKKEQSSRDLSSAAGSNVCDNIPAAQSATNVSTTRTIKKQTKKAQSQSSLSEGVSKVFVGQMVKTKEPAFLEWLIATVLDVAAPVQVTMHTARNGRPKGCAWAQGTPELSLALQSLHKRALIVDGSAMGQPDEEALFVVVVGSSDIEKAWLASCSSLLLESYGDKRHRDLLPCGPLVAEAPASLEVVLQPVVDPSPAKVFPDKEHAVIKPVRSSEVSSQGITWNPSAPAFFSRVSMNSCANSATATTAQAPSPSRWRYDPYHHMARVPAS